MRSPLNPLLGAALAIGVALSASPAIAVAPPSVSPSPETTVQGPNTDPTTTDPGTSDPGVTDGAISEPGVTEPAEPGTDPGTDSGEPETPDAGVTEPEVPGDDSDPTVVTPETDVTDDTDAPDPADNAEVDPELLTEAPDSLSVSGTIAIVSDEVAHPTYTGGPVAGGDEAAHDEAGHAEGELLPGRVLVATDEGAVVEIDPALISDDVVTGDRFEGALELDAAAQTAVESEIAENGPVAVADALTAASSADGQKGPIAGVAGSAIPGVGIAAAPAKKSHGIDLIFFTGGGNPTDASLKKLVADTGVYWNTQSNGAISSMPLNAQKRKAPTGNSKTLRCDARYTNDLWAQGAKAFGRTAGSYLKSGRHLIVVVDDNCGSISKGVAGWGTIGSLHSGGLVWVDTGVRAGGDVSKTTGLLAHEIGHNLGLGHGNARFCSGKTTDAKDSSGRPESPCWDTSYGDPYNVMGLGSGYGGTKPPALAIAQKHQLGVAPSGAVATVRASGGRTQTFTLQPGGNSAGLRGLKVESPTGGNYYVEYRAPVGQDSNIGLASSAPYYYFDFGGTRSYLQYRGVRVLKPYTERYSGTAAKASAVTSVWDTVSGVNGRFQTMRAGTTSTPWNSTARLTVNSVGNTAEVRIDFTPFVDVPYEHKFGQEINWMSSAKLSTGIEAGGSLRKYSPKSNVTREALAAFLYRLEAPQGYMPPKKSPFADVSTNHKFYTEIAWMYTSGLSTGIETAGKRTYAPKNSVTREAMAAFIYRLEGSVYPGATQSPFADMKPGQKFYKEITWMHSSGLSTGIDKNGQLIYSPKGKVTREAMAAFIYRLKH